MQQEAWYSDISLFLAPDTPKACFAQNQNGREYIFWGMHFVHFGDSLREYISWDLGTLREYIFWGMQFLNFSGALREYISWGSRK